ncbi:uncharacterized protein C9orf50 homolog isoform X7 [Rattus norvegicus]|uniref:uncharacterized protein C9orf50 homolog isoform X7 n=1 Tax=Rattus norvegicus TaxID=10116 RepID=UPI00191763B7|nr:uncharacterized protein C9orf50 homolog isoform X6 [Rattus norvegicus]
MFRRQPMDRTPAYKPKGYPDGSTRRRALQQLQMLLPTLDGRAGRGADGAWWRDRKSQHLSSPSPESPYASRGRGALRALLLPPLLQSSLTREAGARGNRQPADRDNPDALGTLLGELLPNKFRHFLHQLRAKIAEPEADPPSAPQYSSSPSEHCPASRCSSSSFLPDSWDQPLNWDDSFREKTTLGLPKGEFVRAKKAHPLPQHAGPQSEDCDHLQPLWRRLKTPQTVLSFPGAIRRRDLAGYSTPVLGT